MYWCILIDWMSQSAVALYIYRVGGLVPQEILLQDLNLWKTLVVLGLYLDRSDRSDLPVRPVGPCRTGHSASIGQTAQSDRSDRLVPILAVNSKHTPRISRPSPNGGVPSIVMFYDIILELASSWYCRLCPSWQKNFRNFKHTFKLNVTIGICKFVWSKKFAYIPYCIGETQLHYRSNISLRLRVVVSRFVGLSVFPPLLFLLLLFGVEVTPTSLVVLCNGLNSLAY